MWVVTRKINDYNQDGEYFVAVYVNKPIFNDLKKLLPQCDNKTIGKLLRGGGRHLTEYEWYYLSKVEEGQEYNIQD